MKFGGISAEMVRSVVERVEKLEEEKAGISADIREIFSEAKGNGLDTKALREVLKIRRMAKHERETHQTMLDIYLHALGMVESAEDQDDDNN